MGQIYRFVLLLELGYNKLDSELVAAANRKCSNIIRGGKTWVRDKGTSGQGGGWLVKSVTDMLGAVVVRCDDHNDEH